MEGPFGKNLLWVDIAGPLSISLPQFCFGLNRLGFGGASFAWNDSALRNSVRPSWHLYKLFFEILFARITPDQALSEMGLSEMILFKQARFGHAWLR
jgi:hypothetical protein